MSTPGEQFLERMYTESMTIILRGEIIRHVIAETAKYIRQIYVSQQVFDTESYCSTLDDMQNECNELIKAVEVECHEIISENTTNDVAQERV